MGASCVTKDGNEVESSCSKMLIRKLWSRWIMLECNVRCDQSLDDSVVSHRVMIIADHPSVIKCGISFADVSDGLDHA